MRRPSLPAHAAGGLVLLAGAVPTTVAAAVVVDCAGAGDHATIGAAVAAAADGETVVVEPCTVPPFAYRESVRVEGRRALRLVAADAFRRRGRAPVAIGGVRRDPPPTRIEAIDGDCVHVDTSHAVDVVGFHLARCGGHGVFVGGLTDVLVHANRIERAAGAGVGGARSTGIDVLGNAFLHNAGGGVRLGPDAESFVADNVFRANGDVPLELAPEPHGLALSNDLGAATAGAAGGDPVDRFLDFSIGTVGPLSVGTELPDRLVDISGPSAEVEIESTGGGDGPELVLNASEGGAVTGSWAFKNRFADGRLTIYRDQDPSLEAVSITPDGRVGVGVKAPAQRLHVVGSGRFEDGIVHYGCGRYAVAQTCPIGDAEGPGCDQVPTGGFCEGDGECGTSTALDNCGTHDWYLKTGE